MQKECNCFIHRYGVCHLAKIRGEWRIFSHSQGDWEEMKRLRAEEIISIPSSLYAHGDTPEELLKKFQIWKGGQEK